MLMISIILNVVLAIILWGSYINWYDLKGMYANTRKELANARRDLKAIYKELRDAQLEYQGIADQYYRDTGEL